MQRKFILLQSAEEELNGLINIENGYRIQRKSWEIIKILRDNPILAGFEKVKGMKKGVKVFKYNVKGYGAQYRLFYTYDKFNFAVIYFDNRDERTYDRKQLKKIERLAIQASWSYTNKEVGK